MVNVPHDPHVAVTSLRDGGAVEQGSVVVYQPSRSTAVWGAEYTTAHDAIKSMCGCDVSWRPHAVYRPRAAISPELTASNAECLGKVVKGPHSDVADWNPGGTAGYRGRQKLSQLTLPPRKTEPTRRWRAMPAPRGREPYVVSSLRRR